MMYRLYDTSVWIDYFKDIDSEKVAQLDFDLSNNQVCICPVIMQEVLQGMRSDLLYNQLCENFKGLHLLQWEAYEAAVSASGLYRQLRKKGVTIRKPNDCLIASFALHFDIEICHNDSDFDLIANHTNLKIWKEKAN